MISLVVLLLACYLLGAFPSGVVVSKFFKGADLSKVGSCSVGATNAYRALGPKAALIVLVLDVLKGFIAVNLAYFVFVPAFLISILRVIFGLLAVVGHNWSIFLKFKGGKGVATTCGVFLALTPKAVGVAVLLWLGIALLTRWASAASLSVAFAFPFIAYAYGASKLDIFFAVIMALMVVFQHRENIERLLHGHEERLNIKFF